MANTLFLLRLTALLATAGLAPIEQIHAGMMVWSAPESGTGAGCFRPVLVTYQNRAPEAWRIAYDHDRNPATPDETLTASAGHPIWVEELQEFVPARDLQPGEHLRLAIDGGSAQVSHITRQRAPPGGIPVFNLAVAEHHTYYAGTGGVWVHNSCAHLDDYVLGQHESFLATFRKMGHAEDVAHDMALDKAMAILRAGKRDAKVLTQTGAELFENTPSIVRGAAADDVGRTRKFLNDTSLGEVPNQPASLVRSGDGGQPFVATPKARMPDDWAELAEKMRSDFGLAPPNPAWKVAEHSEALALKRAVDKLGPGVTEFDIATAGQYVCGHCVGDGGRSGLAEIAMKFGLTKLRIRSELKFQTKEFEAEEAVTIVIDQVSKTWQIMKEIH